VSFREKKQELFNRAVAGLAAQGFTRAAQQTTYGMCVYRAESGKKCAFGHLIPDDKYDATWEGKSPSREMIELVVGGPIDPWSFETLFFYDLQRAHDNAYTPQGDAPEEMKKNLRAFAGKYNLEIPQELAQ
jgi:hypothetical protein